MFNTAIFLTVLVQSALCQVIGHQHNAPYGNAIAANALAETAIASNLAMAPGTVPYPIVNAYEVGVATGVPGLNQGLHIRDLAASRGSGLRVTSSSPISPTGIKVESDTMVLEGPVNVSGQLPFLGVVSLEGPLPAAGHGDVAYGCGNGNVGIVTEGSEVITGYPNAPTSNPGLQRPLY